MHDLIARIQADAALIVREHRDAWMLVIQKGAELRFEITIPRDVLEWFATALDSSGEIWSDWADYYPLIDESAEQLQQAMAAEIESFVGALLASPVRIAKRRLEWKKDDRWQKISLSAP